MSTVERTYEQAVASHRWEVPARYNIAQDVCDKHPAAKPRDDPRALRRRRPRAHLGGLQELANRAGAANLLAEHGIGKGARVAVVLPPTPETAAVFFGCWKLGAVLLSMSVLHGEEGIGYRLTDSQAKLLVTDAANVGRFDTWWWRRSSSSTRRSSAPQTRRRCTPTPAATTLPSSTTRRARPARPRDARVAYAGAITPSRPRGARRRPPRSVPSGRRCARPRRCRRARLQWRR
jgi:non-ribosomal peptide synthetase component F